MRSPQRRALTSMASVIALAVILLSGVFAFGQANATGTVLGVVSDPTGAVVPGAAVTLTDTATGTPRSITTNDQGRYVFTNVAPGTYNLTVSKSGFAAAKIANQQVGIGQQLTANMQLQIGQANQEIVVESTAGEHLQTLNATVGTSIESQTLQELPNLSRDVSSLLTLQPGMGADGAAAGAVRDQNTFQLDGGQNSSDMDGTMNTYTASYASSGGTTGVMPTPVESIEEFKVGITNQTADFNGSAGAQVQMVTRRGTNQWHGALYEFYLGSNFGANSWVNKHTPTKVNGVVVKPLTNLPSNHYNRFGASGGGPLGPKFLGGKTYMFANYEGRRYPQNSTVDKVVPSALLRLGIIQVQNSNKTAVTVQGQSYAPGAWIPINLNPTAVTYNGVTYPAALCPSTTTAQNPQGLCDPRGIGLNTMVNTLWSKYMPLANDATAGDTQNTQGYLTPLKLPQNDNFGVIRLDHDFGDKWHFMSSYRYYHLQRATNSQYDVGGLLGGTFGVAKATSNRPQVPWFLVAGITTNISSNTTNDFHYNFLRNYWAWNTLGAPPQLPGLTGAIEIGGESVNSLIPYNVRTQDARTRYWDGKDNVFRDDVSMLKGNHLLQFGGTYEHNWDAHQRNDNGLGIMAWNVYQIGASSSTNGAVTGLTVTPSSSVSYIPTGIPSGQANNYRNLYAQVLGIVTQPQSLYTRAVPNMSLQPFGSPVIAHSITPSYNVYASDTWHIKPSLTLTYGLGYQVEMPPYETNGKQVMLVDQYDNPVVTEDYLAARKRAALAGQVYNPVLGFAAVPNVGKGRKYPYEPFYNGFSPRLSAAWNPRFDGGILGHIFGQNQTVIRGGWSRLFGRLNGVANILTPLLAPSLLQAVQCQGAVSAANAVNGNQCLSVGGATPVTAFRIGPTGTCGTGGCLDGLTAPLPAAVATLPQPYLPGVNGAAASGDGLALDPAFRPNRVDSFNFTVQREITSKMTVEVGYIGRLIRNELTDLDLNAVPYMTTLGGQTFAQAYAQLYTAVCGLGNTCAGNAYTGPEIPWFAAAFTGGASSTYCTGSINCTAAVASKTASSLKLGAVYDMWSSMASSTAWALGRTLPASNPPGGCIAGSTVCSQVTSIDMSLSNGYGNYNAGFVTFNLRDWHGITGNSNLTYSKALGTGATRQSTSGYTVTDPWNLHNMYGNQTFDTRFLFNSSMSYHIPFFANQSGALGKVLGGWAIAPLFWAQSGFPVEVVPNGACESFGESNCDVGTNENAVLIGAFPGMSQHYKVTSSGAAGASGNYNPPKTFGVNAFADPQAVYNNFRRPILGIDNSSGGIGRIYGFNKWNLDMSITKDTKINERFGAMFYATFTNVLNHMQPGDPSMNFDSPGSWGVVTGQDGSYPSRQLELGLRVRF